MRAQGQRSKVLSPATAAVPPKALAAGDVSFMQGMIMHAQAVEMTDLLRARSKDPAMQTLGKHRKASA